MKNLVWMTALLVTCPALATAQIVTDRPDVAESSETVGALRVQVESGVDVDQDDGMTAFRTPTKLRFGLTEWSELHLESELLAHNRPDAADNQTGVADLDVGGKVHFWDQLRAVPSTGLLVSFTLPVGSDDFTDDAVTASPILAADWDLAADFSLGTNFGASFPLSQRDTLPDLLRYAVALGRPLTPWTDAVGLYGEFFGETPLDGTQSALAVDGGVAWLLMPNFQLDAFARVGLNEAAAGVGGGAGLSARF